MERVVPPARVVKGRQKLEENRALLESVSRKYGVPPRFIVAFWGFETDFGRTIGGFSAIKADRKRVVSGQSVAVRVVLGGRRILEKTNSNIHTSRYRPTTAITNKQ